MKYFENDYVLDDRIHVSFYTAFRCFEIVLLLQ